MPDDDFDRVKRESYRCRHCGGNGIVAYLVSALERYYPLLRGRLHDPRMDRVSLTCICSLGQYFASRQKPDGLPNGDAYIRVFTLTTEGLDAEFDEPFYPTEGQLTPIGSMLRAIGREPPRKGHNEVTI